MDMERLPHLIHPDEDNQRTQDEDDENCKRNKKEEEMRRSETQQPQVADMDDKMRRSGRGLTVRASEELLT